MKELFKNTWVEEDDGVRIFLLTGTERGLIIDTGMSGQDVRALASAHTDLPLQLLTTHADMDHIAGNRHFAEFYMHPSEAFYYYHIQHGTGEMLPVFDGDIIPLGDRYLEVVHLPGHTPGSITLLDKENRCLIGGDPIQGGGEIYMFGQHRDMRAYIASLKRLMKRDDFDVIYPSHSEERVSKDVIPELIRGAEKILAEEVAWTEREMYGKRIAVYDVGVDCFLCDLP